MLEHFIIYLIRTIASTSGEARRAREAKRRVDPGWEARQAEWERARREWEARQLGLMTDSLPSPPPPAVPPIPRARPAKTVVVPPLPKRALPPRGASTPLRFAGPQSARSRFVLYEVLKPPMSMREPP
jgi:hypothetical protein